VSPLTWILFGLIAAPFLFAYERWRSGTFWKRYDDALNPAKAEQKMPGGRAPRPVAVAYLVVTLVLIFGWDAISSGLLDMVKHPATGSTP
jgi:hypothetical protein